jgi:uncharacterized membrane protein
MGSLPWALGGVVMGGILHILCVLSIPQLAKQDAWTRLSSNAKPNTVFLADEKKGTELPFTPSDVLTAYCLFDLSDNNLVVKSPLLEPSWSLALSTRSGENFYVVTGADIKKPSTRLLIIRRDRLAAEASTEKTQEGDDQNIVVSPENSGIIAIRAPLRGESFRDRTLEELQKKVRCEVQKPYEPVVASITEPPPATPSPKVNDPGARPAAKRGGRR